MTARRPAKRPTPRTVTVELAKGDFAGWRVVAKADFAARHLSELQSMELDRVWAVLDVIVLEHNLPDGNDEIAATMADVDPYDGLLEIANGVFDAIGKLPSR